MSIVMRSVRPVAALAATSLVLAGCASVTDASEADYRVVVTTTQLGDWTRNLVSDLPIDVYQLLQPGQDVHEYDPSAADLLALSRADLVIINGSGLDDWLDSNFAAAGYTGAVVDTTESWFPEIAEEYLEQRDHAGEDDDHAHEGDAAHQHAQEDVDHDHADEDGDHDGHDHGPVDPHTWTSVPFAKRQVAVVAAALQEAAPDFATTIAANATRYQAQLDDLDAWIRASIEPVAPGSRTIVTSHASLTWFAAEYDVTEATFGGNLGIGDAEPTEQEFAAIVERFRTLMAEGVDVSHIVASADHHSSKVMQAVAEELGLELVAGDLGLLIDSLAPTGTYGDTYITSQIHNTTLALGSFGAEPKPLPPSLAG